MTYVAPRAGSERAAHGHLLLRTPQLATVVPRAASAPTDAATATPLATQPPTAIITGARYVCWYPRSRFVLRIL